MVQDVVDKVGDFGEDHFAHDSMVVLGEGRRGTVLTTRVWYCWGEVEKKINDVDQT